MAKRKPINVSLEEFERAHLLRIEEYASKVSYIYSWAAKEFAVIAASVNGVNPSKLFQFSDYPQTNERVNKLLKEAYSRILLTINKATEAEWKEALKKNDAFIPKNRRYPDQNLAALKTFQQRKDAGMKLSDRVWKYTKTFKEEIELGLDIGIGEGKTAAQLSQLIRSNLQEPEKLFRRVRDKRGELVLSKAASAYNPGLGVYRSSYKNAMRLTRTEINMAYRASDHERWKQMDFVVGIEVRLSNRANHCPVCEALKGRYPKEFKFIGWHTQCRCYAVSILKTDAEIDADDDRILEGKEPLRTSINQVKDVPKGFKTWIADNKDRVATAKSLPYFIRDNFKKGDVDSGLNFKTAASKKAPPIQKTKEVLSFRPSGIDEYTKRAGITVNEDIFKLLNKDTPLRFTDPQGAYFDTVNNFVNIPFRRDYSSKYKSESVIYHEYGHAADWQNGIKEMPELKALMQAYRDKYSMDRNALYREIDDKLWDKGNSFAATSDMDGMFKATAAHDTLKSLNKEFGTGHSKQYFSIEGRSEAEFIAHMFENKFIGNPIFKEVMPDLYEDMIKLTDDIIKKITQ